MRNGRKIKNRRTTRNINEPIRLGSPFTHRSSGSKIQPLFQTPVFPLLSFSFVSFGQFNGRFTDDTPSRMLRPPSPHPRNTIFETPANGPALHPGRARLLSSRNCLAPTKARSNRAPRAEKQPGRCPSRAGGAATVLRMPCEKNGAHGLIAGRTAVGRSISLNRERSGLFALHLGPSSPKTIRPAFPRSAIPHPASSGLRTPKPGLRMTCV